MTKEKLINSKERVKKHGEVFTPQWMIEKMCDLVNVECEDIYKTFLEPSAGDGRFLLEILKRKLYGVNKYHGLIDRETKSLIALSSIYGIEIQLDNLNKARSLMHNFFMEFHKELNKTTYDKLSAVADEIINKNIVWGNTLTRKTPDGKHDIVFVKWVIGTEIERHPFLFSILFSEK